MTARDAVDTYIDNRLVAPSRIERWESRRASVVLEKLTSRVGTLGMAELLGGVDLAAVDTANSSAMRDMHVTLKQAASRPRRALRQLDARTRRVRTRRPARCPREPWA